MCLSQEAVGVCDPGVWCSRWVAYRQKHYCGEQYILEKGMYKSMSDWGGSDSTIMSIRPIRLLPAFFQLRLYSEPHYRGRCAEYTTEALDYSVFEPMSFRVIHGNWLLFDEEGFAGNQFVLEEGLYPDLTSCGCMATSIKSMKPIQYASIPYLFWLFFSFPDFSEPSISLFSLDSFEGKELVVEESDISLQNKNFFSQSLRVTSGLWVVYEYPSFKGRQMLLTGGEFGCWSDYSGWNTIGSLQPLPQPKVYIRLKNRALGTFLTAEDNVEKSKPSRVSVCPSNGKSTQIWTFSQGLLKSKVNKACMALIGGKGTAGANVALWPEHGRIHQRWRFNKDSTITSYLNGSLVLDVKGMARHTLEHQKPVWTFFDAAFNEVFEGLL
ncbi:CRBG3 protein, partial [Polyodon spathula]|nr:CRBG3 protein [Polyodon spathula]